MRPANFVLTRLPLGTEVVATGLGALRDGVRGSVPGRTYLTNPGQFCLDTIDIFCVEGGLCSDMVDLRSAFWRCPAGVQ